ncbi:leucine-rich repeat and guanylate kinase domain-containing protein isoform X1 [Tachysurus ichikawai]
MESGLSPDSSRSAPEPASPGRPGSNAKPILPPIPQGRKATESESTQQLTGQSGQVDHDESSDGKPQSSIFSCLVR